MKQVCHKKKFSLFCFYLGEKLHQTFALSGSVLSIQPLVFTKMMNKKKSGWYEAGIREEKGSQDWQRNMGRIRQARVVSTEWSRQGVVEGAGGCWGMLCAFAAAWHRSTDHVACRPVLGLSRMDLRPRWLLLALACSCLPHGKFDICHLHFDWLLIVGRKLIDSGIILILCVRCVNLLFKFS